METYFLQFSAFPQNYFLCEDRLSGDVPFWLGAALLLGALMLFCLDLLHDKIHNDKFYQKIYSHNGYKSSINRRFSCRWPCEQ